MTKAEAITKIKKLQALANPKRNTNANERKSARDVIGNLRRYYGITAADLKEPKLQKPVKGKKPAKSRAQRSTKQSINIEAEAYRIGKEVGQAVERGVADFLGMFFR